MLSGKLSSLASRWSRRRVGFRWEISFDGFDSSLEVSQAIRDHIPDNLEIHTKVLVGENIAESRDAAPRHIAIRGPKRVRKFLDSFADDLKVPDASVLSLDIRQAQAYIT
jgi:hypothetical protein